MSNDASRIGGFRKVNDAFPGGILADEILTPGPGQIKALFVTGGNPLITMADAGRLREAFGSLELLVTIDIFRNETGSVAHYTLPATDPLQRADLPFIFPLFMGMQSRPYLQATEALLEPRGEQRDEASIYLGLSHACGAPMLGSRIAQRWFERMARKNQRRARLRFPTVPAEKVLNLILRVTRQPGFRRLLSHPHGLAQPGSTAGTVLGKRIVTDDTRVHLAPDLLVERASNLNGEFAAALARADRMLLITKRHVKTHNSWTHNHEEMIANDFTTNHLYLHPDDATRLGLTDDDLADVRSATATVRVPVRLLDDLMPGVCALPHGWGHQHATGLSVASTTTGVNVNLLAASGPGSVDPMSGMSHLTGIPVDITRAAGALVGTSWSGIEPVPVTIRQ
jgi:formate dehydrogenase